MKPTYKNILVFDTETTTDTKQELRVGYYRYYTDGQLVDAKFFGPEDSRRNVCDVYGEASFLSIEQFRHLLARFAYGTNSLVVGFNLPFDISRIANGWSPARGHFEGGFSFNLTGGTSIRVKHLAKHKALLSFSGKNVKGRFCDVSTIAKAIFSRGFSLGQLGDYLGVQTQKGTTDYNGPIDRGYLEYLCDDVRCTYECFLVLLQRWNSYALDKTRIDQIISEASIGKAVLKQMRVRPFMEQNNWPPELLGTIMGTYYGGRSEVHLRKREAPVVCLDFLSMYPTVCSLMDLWKFVIADEIISCDLTELFQQLIDVFTLDDLLDMDWWENMSTICQVQPDEDIFPVRAKYNGVSRNIGVNYVHSDTPLWYTFADCLASKLLTGKAPKIIKAIHFYPSGVQSQLKPVDLLGNPEYTVDPKTTDMYRRLIELRTTRTGDDKLAIKIIANSTCYGIFIEVITNAIAERSIEYYSEEKHAISLSKEEKAGIFFNPLLATLITGAARLLLAATETLARNNGLEWVLCDTDSMFLTGQLENIPVVTSFFKRLNPYNVDVEVLKNENGGRELRCLAISAKRYVIYDIESNIYKASSHGLGHLSAPYGSNHTDTGAPEWVNTFWNQLISGNESLDDALLQPAMAQFTASTPRLAAKIDPFSFVSVFQTGANFPGKKVVPIAPYGRVPDVVAKTCFDVDSGKPIPSCYLKTYDEVLRDYPFHYEAKFNGGDDEGWTERRHVYVTGIGYIGKEGNKLEEQEVGVSTSSVLDYGVDTNRGIELLKKHSCSSSYADLGRRLSVSRSEIQRICTGQRRPSRKLLQRIGELGEVAVTDKCVPKSIGMWEEK
jgi:hypothetical protein